MIWVIAVYTDLLLQSFSSWGHQIMVSVCRCQIHSTSWSERFMVAKNILHTTTHQLITPPRSSFHWDRCTGFCRPEAFSYMARRYPFLSRVRDCSIHNFVLKIIIQTLSLWIFNVKVIYVCRQVVWVVTISYWDTPSLSMARPQSPTHNHFYTYNSKQRVGDSMTPWLHDTPVCCNLGSIVPLCTFSRGRRGRL